jgi:hypothetical protein
MSDIKGFVFPTPSETLIHQMTIAVYNAASRGHCDEVHEIIKRGVAHLTERLDMYDRLARAMVEPPKPIMFQAAERYDVVQVTRNGAKLVKDKDWKLDENGSVILLGGAK